MISSKIIFRKQLTFRDAMTSYPQNDIYGMSAEIPYWWCMHDYPNQGSASYWLKQIPARHK